jgi:hypothetical protein
MPQFPTRPNSLIPESNPRPQPVREFPSPSSELPALVNQFPSPSNSSMRGSNSPDPGHRWFPSESNSFNGAWN